MNKKSFINLFPKFNELKLLLLSKQPFLICLSWMWLTPSASFNWWLHPFSKWRCSAPTRRWRCFIYNISPHAHSLCDRCASGVEMIGCFPLSHHIAVFLVYRSPCSKESDDDIALMFYKRCPHSMVSASSWKFSIPPVSTSKLDYVPCPIHFPVVHFYYRTVHLQSPLDFVFSK